MLRWLVLRCLILFGVALLLSSLDAPAVFAQAPSASPTASSWPSYPLPPAPTAFPRGPGFYLAIWKIMACWIVFAMWVYTTDWISQDVLRYRFKHVVWNPIAFFSLVVAFILVWVIPWFFVGFVLMLIAYVAPLSTYVWYHNKNTPPDENVLTKQHLRRWFVRKINKIGGKFEEEAADPFEAGPDVKLSAQGAATDREDNINLLTARQSLGFQPARELIFDAVNHRADAVMLDYTAEAVAVRYQIDGVWHNYAPQERAAGDVMLAVLKTLAALNVNERRAKQSGKFRGEVAKKKYSFKINSQGTQTGEAVVIQFIGPRAPMNSLEELGMRPKMEEQITGLLAQKKGFVLVTSMPAGGLTTTFDVLLKSTDRYMRNFVAVQDVGRPEQEIENVLVTTYNPLEDETPATVLPKLVRTYPDVIVCRDLVDAETVKILCEQVQQDRLVIGAIRAKEAVEGLLRVLMLKVPPPQFAAAASGVLNVRLVRKLCEKCKEAYAPPPDVLKQLGLPAGRIEALYRPPTQPIDPKNPDKVCETCLGVGYLGRTGIFELVVVDDAIRQVLGKTPKLDLLRDAVRKSKQRSLQEEGILLVAKGVTSIPELMRVLKV
jgi:type II secretory ATPase GspE/PulE/Tfp pilus assembly ATPase PilB-like protein